MRSFTMLLLKTDMMVIRQAKKQLYLIQIKSNSPPPKEYISFDKASDAQDFANNGYKRSFGWMGEPQIVANYQQMVSKNQGKK